MTTESKPPPETFFHGFADTFDTFYDGKRSPVMQWIDRRFRSDMFIRYELTFSRLGDLSGRRGIDIGCGSGPYVAEALPARAPPTSWPSIQPRGCSISPGSGSKNWRLSDRLTTVEGYFPQAAPPGPFDFAIVMGVMDYVARAGRRFSRRCGRS